MFEKYVKLLPKNIHTRCFGCVHDHLSQRKHHCLMIGEDKCVPVHFEEISKKAKQK